ncbi:MAG: response regulator [Candidatus Methylacidiphilales bacterium]|nr:response regulator [Candidatus Methylacidiphilales bacterium]
MPTALIIDDEPAIRRLLRLALEGEGYRVLEADEGRVGLLEAARARPEVIVLDLGLPDKDGLEVLKNLREWSQIPVLILSVRDDEQDKVRALDLGADDFVNKPFGTSELLARLRAVQRRAAEQENESPVFRSGGLEVDLAARRVRVQGVETRLTATEYHLLRLLIRHAGKIVTQKQLLREVWGPQAEEQTQYLRVHLTHLRKKIDPKGTGLVETEPRVGYRLKAS